MNKIKRIILLCAICCLPILTIAQDKGVLILAHGGSTEWNDAVIQAAVPLQKDYAVEVAFGMANYVTMHHAIKNLEEKGVSSIAVVQLFISSHSPIIEQNQYLLGARDSLPERPMPLMHHVAEYKKMMNIKEESASHSTSHASSNTESRGHSMYMPKDLKPIPTTAEIIVTPALDDHPVVAQILNKRIQELSSEPTQETVLLVAHGPNNEDNNRKWISNMESLAQKIQALQKSNGSPYKQIFSLTVRDDAPDAIFNQAKENLRNIVRQADMNGDVIVVPLFLSSGGREQAVEERLEGLNFKWSGKTLLPDPLISEFMIQSVEQAFDD